ncbi:MAG: TIGR03759 family integrating conjugative element protein [Methylococcales bacterium]|nr:TIGR03759 family integrating conjugative element protein [Methylococcales bacterium]
MMNQLFSTGLLLTLFVISLTPVNATQTKEKKLKHTPINVQELAEESHRQQWALSKADWARYKTLMQGIRGSISPQNISPIEVLGTHARTDAERRKYAETWARMRHEDIDRILAFQLAYNQAFARLYPNEQIINTKLLNLVQGSDFKTGDRVLIFVKVEQCAECEKIIQQVMRDEVAKKLHVDIYFVDTKNKIDDDKIRQWAKRQQIDAQRLKIGRITLNHDKGTLYRMTHKFISSVPLVFSINSNQLKRIHY